MKILVFGEILWDVFPGKYEIGGAPLNFGAHLSKLGGEVQVVSAVGKDGLGQESLKMVRKFGIDDRFIKVLEKPTGVCNVSVDEYGNPTYYLVRDVAYDNITVDEEALKLHYDAFYMGTLARRSVVSSETFKKLVRGCNFDEVFCDINIRQDFYTREIVEESLVHSTILKISEEEAFVFKETGLLEYSNLEELSIKLAKEYDIKIILVTLGEEGAFLYSAKDKEFHKSKPTPVKVVSTVGAGDSFSAAFLYNYLKGNNLQACLDKAVQLSSFVVTRLGAVPEYDPSNYQVR
ncbi:MAG TPA: carbohydrate kinase [Clostridiaceae bacterium]|jgi:fructokinase|nr:carbohydrate kinase [Clostridiaceae bacterium]